MYALISNPPTRVEARIRVLEAESQLAARRT